MRWLIEKHEWLFLVGSSLFYCMVFVFSIITWRPILKLSKSKTLIAFYFLLLGIIIFCVSDSIVTQICSIFKHVKPEFRDDAMHEMSIVILSIFFILFLWLFIYTRNKNTDPLRLHRSVLILKSVFWGHIIASYLSVIPGHFVKWGYPADSYSEINTVSDRIYQVFAYIISPILGPLIIYCETSTAFMWGITNMPEGLIPIGTYILVFILAAVLSYYYIQRLQRTEIGKI